MYELSIYVPSESNGVVVDYNERRAVLEEVAENLISKFGGATSVEGRGWWSSNERTATENVDVIHSVVEHRDEAHDAAVALATYIKLQLDQECVMYKIVELEEVGFI